MRLEDFIKNNEEEFLIEEPPKGHFERFEKRLKESKKLRRKPSNIRYLAGLAAALAALVIGLNIFITDSQNEQVCIMSEEMIETQNYYMSLLGSEAKNVKILLDKVDLETREEVLGDVKQIVAETESFTDNFCNNSEDGMAIMVEYYQSKIQALENISTIFEDFVPE